MEKIFNENEKLRRAEEIYFKRNNKNIVLSCEKDEHVKYKKNFFKFYFYIMFFVNLIVFFVAFQYKNEIFNQSFLSTCNDMNYKISKTVNDFINNTLKKDNKNDLSDVINENEVLVTNEVKNEFENLVEDNSNVVSVLDQDLENLKAYNFINPLSNGVVTSGFGDRFSKYQNVSGYHKGIDISAEKGTNIFCSMEGIVTLVSSKGDYGNHVKIRCNNITTLYAHCHKIFVEEGQIIGQGQVIATVGSTGNSTGNHLHFEIRIDDSRYIDPAKIINFKL